MPPQRRKYYAVHEGRVDKPTIYSSWAQAHPRVTQCENKYEGFKTRQEAIDWLKRRGAADIDDTTERGITAQRAARSSSEAKGTYHAVAYGMKPGVFSHWEEAKASIDRFPSACYQKFDTEHEAKKFIEDWKDAYADVWRRAIRRGLDDGWKPVDLAVDVARVMVKQDVEVESVCAKFEGLGVGRDSGVKSESLV